MKNTNRKFIIKGEATDVSIEDGGCAKILTLTPPLVDDVDGMFIRIQSWYENPESKVAHQEINSLIGKTIRVTIEVLK